MSRRSDARQLLLVLVGFTAALGVLLGGIVLWAVVIRTPTVPIALTVIADHGTEEAATADLADLGNGRFSAEYKGQTTEFAVDTGSAATEDLRLAFWEATNTWTILSRSSREADQRTCNGTATDGFVALHGGQTIHLPGNTDGAFSWAVRSLKLGDEVIPSLRLQSGKSDECGLYFVTFVNRTGPAAGGAPENQRPQLPERPYFDEILVLENGVLSLGEFGRGHPEWQLDRVRTDAGRIREFAPRAQGGATPTPELTSP